ncbi:MAG: hypothetical protein AAB214_19525 [Fibrobacterota bacterium]
MEATNQENGRTEISGVPDEARCTGNVRLCDNPGLTFRRIGHCRFDHRVVWVYGVSRTR